MTRLGDGAPKTGLLLPWLLVLTACAVVAEPVAIHRVLTTTQTGTVLLRNNPEGWWVSLHNGASPPVWTVSIPAQPEAVGLSPTRASATGDVIIVTVESHNMNAQTLFIALERSDGSVRWMTAAAQGAWLLPNSHVLMVNSTTVQGLSTADGSILWSHEQPDCGNSDCRPSVQDGELLYFPFQRPAAWVANLDSGVISRPSADNGPPHTTSNAGCGDQLSDGTAEFLPQLSDSETQFFSCGVDGEKGGTFEIVSDSVAGTSRWEARTETAVACAGTLFISTNTAGVDRRTGVGQWERIAPTSDVLGCLGDQLLVTDNASLALLDPDSGSTLASWRSVPPTDVRRVALPDVSAPR